MPSLNMSVPHQLSQDDALNRIKQYVAQAKMQYSDKISDIQESWNDYVGTFNVSASGFSGSGNVIVTPSDVIIQSSLPLIAIPFKGRIESFVRALLTKVLA